MNRTLLRGLGAFLAEALTVEERSRLTVRLYNGHRGYYEIGHRTLEPWERAWFDRRLPRPPARILVGACGDGREARALQDVGYEVHAFDPAPGLAALAQKRLGPRSLVGSFRYEDLCRAVFEGVGIARHFASERYDAVVLGLGSLTHVLDSAERKSLVRALDLLCSAGPLLASFWCAEQAPAAAFTPSRSARWGRRIGRVVGRTRGLGGGPGMLAFGAHYGFASWITTAEIDTLGALIGRKVTWEDDDTASPHVTLLAPSTSTP